MLLRKVFLKAEMPEMREYEIKVKMVNSNVERMDLTSLKKSQAVKNQAMAAKRSTEQVNA